MGTEGQHEKGVSDLVSFIGDVLKSGIARVTPATNSRQQCGTLVCPCSELSQLERLLEMRTNGNAAPGLVITVTEKPQAPRLWPLWPLALCAEDALLLFTRKQSSFVPNRQWIDFSLVFGWSPPLPSLQGGSKGWCSLWV